MVKRPIIEIDRDKCNGCKLCTTACAEGALVMDEHNKAVLGKEIYCDGLGACLDVCPTGALTIVERDSAEYDPEASYEHVLNTRGEEAAKKVHGHAQACGSTGQTTGCPGTSARELSPPAVNDSVQNTYQSASELTQWPIQLHLVSPAAPYFQNVDLLIAASCTAFSMGSFHQDLLQGKKLVIACPKLDRTEGYVEKLTELIKNNTVYSITVAMMTVPCCTELGMMVEKAVELSGKSIAVKKIIIGLEGNIV